MIAQAIIAGALALFGLGAILTARSARGFGVVFALAAILAISGVILFFSFVPDQGPEFHPLAMTATETAILGVPAILIGGVLGWVLRKWRKT